MRSKWLFLLAAIFLSISAAAFLMPDTKAEQAPVNLMETGRIPGDDVPAREPEIIEEDENELIEAALLARAHIIEDCTVTYYCAEKYPHICGTGDGMTATGTYVTPGVSCAVDPSVIPYGSTVIVDYGDGELHYYVADDCGGAINGSRIDLCVGTHKEALQEGIKTATVYWAEE